MRSGTSLRSVVGLAAVALAACTDSEPARAPLASDASFAAGVPDLVGTPDLIVDQHRLGASWVIYEQTFSPTGCTAIEGNFPGGTYRVLRFTVTTPNVGDADVVVGNPRAHVDPNGDGNFSDSDGLFEFATCHAHFHFRNYATYELFPVNANGSLGTAVLSKKAGFCMIDVTPYRADVSPNKWVYRNCGNLVIDGNQGISTGWADTYVKHLVGQFFILNEPGKELPAGDYVIRITVNPPFTPQAGEACPAQDLVGKCHMFTESDYTNNVAEVRISVPDRVGKLGWGPGGGQQVQAETMDKLQGNSSQ